MSGERTCQVRVGVRVRPLASKELRQGGKVSLSVIPPASISIASHETFTYDVVFDSETNQDDLYSSVSSSLLDSFVDGYNATILAYGQTGSGKTYTMGSEAYTQPEGSLQLGLIPRFISAFFEKMQEKKQASNEAALREEVQSRDSHVSEETSAPMLLDYHMKASFLEVYGEDVFDLLDSERKSLPLREDSAGGVVIAGLTDKTISSPAEALDVLHEGTNNRTTAATLMNLTSSRSHAVFTIHLTQKTRAQNRINLTATSKFTFVDLAGSERMKKTGAEGERAREGIKINEGLLALGNVINALADEDRLAKEKPIHVPYRQSKLTRLLQDALGGNSQTFFLACVSPSDTNVGETLSTLRYANRARNIRNAPTKNLDPTTSELHRLNMLTRVLQTELIKARFQDMNDKENSVGEVDDSLIKRSDVVEYLDLIHRTANELSGVDKAPSLVFKSITPAAHPSVSGVSFPIPSARLDGPPSTFEATPSSERIQDSFLIDVNPDEDLAILDRLLELQQHDHEFDKAKERDDESLQKMDGELRKEETLLLQLRESMKAYHSLKQKYEELMAEVQQLEVEKDSLAKQLEKATADPATGNSAAIRRQLEKVELSLNRARRETLSHRQTYKAAEDQARRCQVLERKISTLKQAKASLLQKQKETVARYKEVTEAKTKELLALKRKEKASDARLSKMKTEIQQHKSNLEKREQYCTKLSDKLNQTEIHLMRLLSMKQRDFGERASVVGKKGLSTLNVSCAGEDNVPVSNHVELLRGEDLKSIQFISDKMVSEKIEQAVAVSQYRHLVTEYSKTMRSVVSHVNLLQEREAETDENGTSGQSTDEIKENIAELELKLELLGAEVKEMESLLPDENKQARDEEAVKKLLSKLPAMALRKMLFESFSRVVDLETEKRAKQELLSRKDSVLSSLENELDMMQGKVESLTRDLVNRRILTESGDDLFDLLKHAEDRNKALDEELARVRDATSRSDERIRGMEKELKAKTEELENTKDALVLVETTLVDMNGSVKSGETLTMLQTLWAELGVEETTRGQVRSELKTCIEDTCDRHLAQASKLLSSTKEEIAVLKAKKSSMQAALSLSESQEVRFPGLLKEVQSLRDEVGKLEVVFNAARSRRDRVLSDMISLSSALGIRRSDLPSNLQNLMMQIEGGKPSSTTIGRLRRASIMENVQGMVDSISSHFSVKSDRIDSSLTVSQSGAIDLPQGSLEVAFLGRCEDDIASLRVKKSELLVKNRERVQKIREIAKSLHSTVPEMVRLVENAVKGGGNSLPIWWDSDDAAEILKKTIVTSPRVDSVTDDARYMQLLYEALESVAGDRERISSLLIEIVENAQQALLDIVGRELDASEACTSFRDALLKLPSLSVDLCQSCISEMEALIVGVEAMTQSEIEALTVVWEALKVSSEDRREFWGSIDGGKGASRSARDGSDRFDHLKQSLSETQNTEGWIMPLVLKGKSVHQELEVKLNKLSAIHKEVEKLRSKQDTKSQVISLDSEIRILNSKLQDFEELRCSKQRLLTKKAGSTALLKEARFRQQMKSKFVSKLEQLASLLRLWELEEGCSFDATMLSDDVRMLLSNPGNMESWIDKRTKLMPSRTVPTKPSPRKRSFEEENQSKANSNPGGLTPPRKKLTASSRKTKLHAHGSNYTSDKPARSPMRKRKVSPMAPLGNAQEQSIHHNSSTTVPISKRVLKAGRKDSTALPPFGRILSELSSPNKEGSK